MHCNPIKKNLVVSVTEKIAILTLNNTQQIYLYVIHFSETLVWNLTLEFTNSSQISGDREEEEHMKFKG